MSLGHGAEMEGIGRRDLYVVVGFGRVGNAHIPPGT